jgi:hypothetical protein
MENRHLYTQSYPILTTNYYCLTTYFCLGVSFFRVSFFIIFAMGCFFLEAIHATTPVVVSILTTNY